MKPYEEFPEFSLVTVGETPNGGVKTVAYFFDSSGNRCTEAEATSVQILELDENDVCIFSVISKL